MRRSIDIGILLSTDGTYRHMATGALAGTQDALAEINQDAGYDFLLRARHINPQARLADYSAGVAQLIGAGVRHIFGTITSASRKEIIPDLEQHNALLWYGSPYEGFESSEQVIYLGGCPNQTLVPLLRLALENFGTRAFLIGSNYVWGWESNRIAREVVTAVNGEITGEKFLHLGHTRVDEVVHSLLAGAPSFVLNNLVGESSYAFLRRLDDICARRHLSLPVLSCNLTEAELSQLGEIRALRLFSCGPFFETADPLFCARQRRRHGPGHYSHYYTGAYLAVLLFARALQQTDSLDPQRICEALYDSDNVTFMGPMKISRRNNHTYLPCHITELRHGVLELIHSEDHCLAPDPYLTLTDLRQPISERLKGAGRPMRIVK
ncbi:transporter substrate-binding protein [Sodalis ligni]|uniref:transporter substrate-binding protein n=1 Tax=Sodalis ligni TaxID=2697027 RepID=UPI00193FDC0A|nr:transporter substrate-binding protein [Sodalis ligni]QWA13242.1 transporter substrate-binding protein [Sodalis ligni]